MGVELLKNDEKKDWGIEYLNKQMYGVPQPSNNEYTDLNQSLGNIYYYYYLLLLFFFNFF